MSAQASTAFGSEAWQALAMQLRVEPTSHKLTLKGSSEPDAGASNSDASDTPKAFDASDDQVPYDERVQSQKPFAICVVKQAGRKPTAWYHSVVYVSVNDALVREELGKLYKDVPTKFLDFFKGPVNAKQFYHYMGRLIKHCHATDTEASAELKLLADWAHSYRDPIWRDVEEKRERGVITHDLIWALSEPGELVVVTADFNVKNIDACAQYQGLLEEWVDGELQLVKAKWRYISADNEHYGFQTRSIRILPFEGERRIEDLDVFPLRCHPDYEGMRVRLVARGGTFVSLTSGGAHHRQYVDAVYQNTPGAVPTGILNDRIMIDYDAFALRGLKEHLRLFPSITPGPTGWLDAKDFGDDELLCCSPIVVVFYLGTGQWANALVRDIQEIKWRNLSIAQDVAMPKKAKQKLELATQIAKNGPTSETKDAKVSTLMIFHGPEGVGKAWSIEVMAEQLKLPIMQFAIRVQSTARDSSTPRIAHELCLRWRALFFVYEPINAWQKDQQTHQGRAPQHFLGVEGFLRNLETVPGAVCVLSTAHIDYLATEIVRTATYHVKFPSLEKNAKGSGGSFEAAEHMWKLEFARGGLAAEKYDTRELAKKPARTARSISSLLALAKQLASIRGELPTMDDLESAEIHLNELVESNGGEGPASGLYQ